MATSPPFHMSNSPKDRGLQRVLLQPSLVDWVAIVYLSATLATLVWGEPGAARTHFLLYVGGILVAYVLAVAVYRWLKPTGPVGQRLYRCTPLVAGCAVYFRLPDIYPIVHPTDLDAQLHQIDLWLVGTDLSVWLEPHTTGLMVDWLSFFYWLYFPLVVLTTSWAILVSTQPARRTSFATGAIVVILVGIFTYTLVPGIGPWHFLADDYEAPLRGGAFYEWMWDIYRMGVGRDIFPSVHTALSLWTTIFLVWERRAHRGVWAALAFVGFLTANIMVATIVLRWHYLVDLLAGMVLAGIGAMVASRGLRWYETRRQAAGVEPGYW
ncbi:phosphatase PAP2 family protein [Myxococcota bacterium]